MTSHYLHKPHRQLKGFSLYFNDNLAFIVIDRGENRINSEFVEVFNILLDEVEKNESCKGLITTGVGKFYSNGLDFEFLGTLKTQDLVTFNSNWHSLQRRILCFPLPTLAAINGHAFAGGALIALAHDLRTFRLDKGWLSLNEVFINGRLRNHYLFYIRTKVGSGKNINEAVILGKRYTAEEAFKSGLVHATPKESLLLSESVRLLKSFIGKEGYPRDSLVNMKEDVYKDYLDSFKTENQYSEIVEAISKL